MIEENQGNRSVNNDGKLSFFRGGKSVKEIFDMADFNQMELQLITENEKLDGCSESCEPF